MKQRKLPNYIAAALERNQHRIDAGENLADVLADVVNVHPLLRRDVWAVDVTETQVSIFGYVNGNKKFWRVYPTVDEACAALFIIANGGVPPLKHRPIANSIISRVEEAASTEWLSVADQGLFFSDELYPLKVIAQMTNLRGLPRFLRKTYVRSLGWLPFALRARLGCR